MIIYLCYLWKSQNTNKIYLKKEEGLGLISVNWSCPNILNITHTHTHTHTHTGLLNVLIKFDNSILEKEFNTTALR